MFSSPLPSQSPLSKYITYPQDQPPSKLPVLSRIRGIFNQVQTAIKIAAATIFSAASYPERRAAANKIFGEKNVIVISENKGKLSDANRYDILYELNEKGREILEPYGMDIPYLVPQFSDKGKCFGADVTIIRDHIHEGKSVREIAPKFEGGVPFESAVLQDLYRSSMQGDESNFSTALSEIIADPARNLDPYEQSLTQPQMQVIKETRRVGMIKSSSSSKAAYILSITAPEDLATVKRTLNTPDVPLNKHAIARLNDLEIDWSTRNTGPQEIIDTVAHLPVGRYSLSLPFTDPFGRETGRFHAVSIFVEEGGLSYLHDQGIGIGYMLDRTQTVERLIEEYTGYKKEGTGILGRIKNCLLLRPNFSSALADRGFQLARYKKFQQL